MKACDSRLLLDGKDKRCPNSQTYFPSFQTPDSRNGGTQKQSQLTNSCWGTCMNLLVAESLRFAAGLSGLAEEREESVQKEFKTQCPLFKLHFVWLFRTIRLVHCTLTFAQTTYSTTTTTFYTPCKQHAQHTDTERERERDTHTHTHTHTHTLEVLPSCSPHSSPSPLSSPKFIIYLELLTSNDLFAKNL
jgi:hypothetical protein